MTDTVRPMQDIARRLYAGETLTSAQVVEEYQASTGLLGQVLSKMAQDGATFHRERISGTSANAVTILTPVPPNDAVQGIGDNVVHLQRNRKAKQAARKTRSDKGGTHLPKEARRPAAMLAAAAQGVVAKVNGNGHSSLAHPVPQLGDKIEVYLLMLDDDGGVNVGLRSDTANWLVGVNGFAARDR